MQKVTVVKVGDVIPHPAADNLDIALYRGGQYIVERNSLAAGDLAFLWEKGAKIPKEDVSLLGIASRYKPSRGVQAIEIRGEESDSLLVAVDQYTDPSTLLDRFIEFITLGMIRRIWREGDDATEFWS